MIRALARMFFSICNVILFLIIYYTIICEVIFRIRALTLKVRVIKFDDTLNEFLYIIYYIVKNKFYIINIIFKEIKIILIYCVVILK